MTQRQTIKPCQLKATACSVEAMPHVRTVAKAQRSYVVHYQCWVFSRHQGRRALTWWHHFPHYGSPFKYNVWDVEYREKPLVLPIVEPEVLAHARCLRIADVGSVEKGAKVAGKSEGYDNPV